MNQAVEQVTNPLKKKEIVQMAFQKEKSGNTFKSPTLPYPDMPEYQKISDISEKFSLDLFEWRQQLQFVKDMNELKEFEMKPYPGSQLGPLPEDDPAFYRSWYLQNVP